MVVLVVVGVGEKPVVGGWLEEVVGGTYISRNAKVAARECEVKKCELIIFPRPPANLLELIVISLIYRTYSHIFHPRYQHVGAGRSVVGIGPVASIGRRVVGAGL